MPGMDGLQLLRRDQAAASRSAGHDGDRLWRRRAPPPRQRTRRFRVPHQAGRFRRTEGAAAAIVINRPATEVVGVAVSHGHLRHSSTMALARRKARARLLSSRAAAGASCAAACSASASAQRTNSSRMTRHSASRGVRRGVGSRAHGWQMEDPRASRLIISAKDLINWACEFRPAVWR